MCAPVVPATVASGHFEIVTKGRLAVASWVVFDIGQSLFYVAVVGLFFPLWVTRHLGGDDATVGFTMAAAMLFMLVIGPVAGAFSDQMGRRKPFLIASTLVCIGSTLLMGGDSLAAALTLFGLAVITVNTASIFYNALLVNVSSEATRGTVSGVGVGVGYLGAVLAVATGLIFVQSGDYAVGFRIIGVIFILTSLPLFLFLKETPQHEEGLPVLTKAERTFEQLRSTLGLMSRVPGMTRFILVRFWYVWAVNTASTSSGPHHQDSGEAKIRESTAGVSRKPSSDGKARGCSSKQLSGLTAWNT